MPSPPVYCCMETGNNSRPSGTTPPFVTPAAIPPPVSSVCSLLLVLPRISSRCTPPECSLSCFQFPWQQPGVPQGKRRTERLRDLSSQPRPRLPRSSRAPTVSCANSQPQHWLCRSSRAAVSRTVLLTHPVLEGPLSGAHASGLPLARCRTRPRARPGSQPVSTAQRASSSR